MACDKSRYKEINANTRAVVVGTGRSGRAAVKFLKHLGAKIRVLDNNIKNVPADFAKYLQENKIPLIGGEHLPEHFTGADIVIPSPGAPVNSIYPLLPRTNAPDVIAETELASRFIFDEAILAFTGTSGKTTTTSLASAMLEEHGFTVFTGGNIGTPLCEYILERDTNKQEEVDIIVLELSSFQLQACHTLNPRIAVLLNVSENHLDYHKDMQEYIDSKMRIFRCQDENDIAIIGESVQKLAEEHKVQSRIVVFKDMGGRFKESNLFGKHNILNAEAAFTAVKEFGVGLTTAQKAVKKFKPIEHRLEKVVEKDGILFVNDSKGTTVESLKIALQAFDRPILLLVGGKFKGGDLESLKPLLKEKVKSIILYGASREYFEKAWKDVVPMQYIEKLQDAVKEHYKNAKKNDVILLSPATSSFDQYPNYLQRGKDFKTIAKKLAK